MKKRVEQVNIWFSPTTKQWLTCAWLPFDMEVQYNRDETFYKKERVVHYSFDDAVRYVKDHYKEEK